MPYKTYHANPILNKLPNHFLTHLCEIANDKSATLGLVTRTHENLSDFTKLKTASITLTPSPIPKTEFQKIYDIQPVFNQLLSNIVNKKPEWIVKTLESVKEPFLEELLKVRAEISKSSLVTTATLIRCIV